MELTSDSAAQQQQGLQFAGSCLSQLTHTPFPSSSVLQRGDELSGESQHSHPVCPTPEPEAPPCTHLPKSFSFLSVGFLSWCVGNTIAEEVVAIWGVASGLRTAGKPSRPVFPSTSALFICLSEPPVGVISWGCHVIKKLAALL